MILVEREYDGDKCGECPHKGYDGFLHMSCCAVFAGEITVTGGEWRRLPACLATPPARVLTPEMVKHAKRAVARLESRDVDDCIAADLRAAFGIEEG
jgi:hypothetical protein